MVEIEFDHLQKKTVIQANLNDSFSKIVTAFINKTNLNLKNLYFLSNGKNLSLEEKIKNIMSEAEKQNKKMIILVQNLNSSTNIVKDTMIKSNDIICPTCKEICKFEIKGHRLKLYGCKNGHIKDNIKLKEYSDTQKIDISTIKCNKCGKSKFETFNQEMFICCECNINLCPLCKSIHDNSHSIINYENKNYVCNLHDEQLFKYCENCKKDLCLLCLEEHKYHNVISYEDKLINIKDLRKKMNDLYSSINKFKNNIEDEIKKLKNIIKNMEIFYNIYNNIIEKCEKNKNRNYNLLLNLHYINDSINDEINMIQNIYNFGLNLNELNVLYEEMNEKKEKDKYQKSREKNELITINFLITSGHKHFIKCKPDITIKELISYFYNSLKDSLNIPFKSFYLYSMIIEIKFRKVFFIYKSKILDDHSNPPRIDGFQIYDGSKIIVLDPFGIFNACFQNKGFEIDNEIVYIISEINKIGQFNERLNSIKEQKKPLFPQMIRILFTTPQGEKTFITVNYGTTIDVLLRKYLKIKGMEDLYRYKSNRIRFLYNAYPLKFGDISVVEKFFKNIILPKIVVNENDSLFCSDFELVEPKIYSHFENLYEKLMLLLKPLLPSYEPLLKPAIEGEITIKFNKKGNIIKIKMDANCMVAELLYEYSIKTNTKKGLFKLINETILSDVDCSSLADVGLKNNSEIIVS